MTAAISRRRYVFLAGVLVLAGAVWGSRHAAAILGGEQNPLAWFVLGAFAIFLGLAWLERPHTATGEQRAELDKLVVTANIPLYNEDPAIVRKVLTSLLEQTRKPNRVEVVDDGSAVDYTPVMSWWLEVSRAYGIDGRWRRVSNGGKRQAQLTTFRTDTTSDIFLTVDSDSVLAPNAIEEGLLPFADPKISSVAAVVLAMNARANLVTRLTDLMFLNFQLVTRSGLSTLGSVLVNSGGCSFYRADVVREAIPAYEAETFLGREVQFSDDSFLTLAAYMRGKTVQQPSAMSYTWLPENVGHHLRQQLRWFRGSTIRSIWRFRYLPMNRPAYWVHFVNWMNFALVGALMAYVLVVQPAIHGELAPWVLGVSALISYATALKYLTVRRSDVPFRWQLVTFAMAPLLMVWSALVLRPLRLYGMVTCYRTGSWGTRQQGVEVSAGLEAAA